MLKESCPYCLANRPSTPNTDLELLDNYTGEVATRVAMADGGQVGQAGLLNLRSRTICILPAGDQRGG